MRFNKQELMTLATQPSQKFEKEGTLYVRERQEGFFRRTDTSSERWCRLRGNLLFYFKSREQWSEPLGVIILEHCTFKLDESAAGHDIYFGFSIVFDGGLLQQLGATSSQERDAWLQSLQLASYECMRSQMLALRQRIEAYSGHKHDTDIHMLRLQRGIITDADPAEIPVCEISVACDNLLCDGHGRPPNPVLEIDVEMSHRRTWIKYAKTEIVERSSNPSFLTTISFRGSDNLSVDTKVRITAYDVRERVSQTATPIGCAIVTFGAVQDTPRLRIPLKSQKSTTVGFLTINVWNLEAEDKGNSTEGTPSRTVLSITSGLNSQIFSHRRSHSLPPRLGTKIKLPHQGQFKYLFANPYVQTYRFHSGLGGDICVHEIMAESKLCFQFPQQLLAIWIHEEKELLQEVAGMGELREPWHGKQVQLLDRHLHLLHLYSQAKENLSSFKGSYFKRSTRKTDRTLEFAPVNLHLQRMWVHNDTLNKCGFYDFISVGAFAAHSHKSKNGGLIRLVQALKESPARHANLYQGSSKIIMAHDAIQAIKQLRRDVVEAMRSLMKLARDKETSGMLPICEDMISKTRILLSLWDPGLVEEALTFLEEHKIAQIPNYPQPPQQQEQQQQQQQQQQQLQNQQQESFVVSSTSIESRINQQQQSLSPFKRITQQLNFDLKNSDFDDLISPDTPECVQDLWVDNVLDAEKTRSKYTNHHEDFIIFPNVGHHNEHLDKSWPNDKEEEEEDNDDDDDDDDDDDENDDDGDGERDEYNAKDEAEEDGDDDNDDEEKKKKKKKIMMMMMMMMMKKEKNNEVREKIDLGKPFLDTQKMCNSPSANYYKPTDEPEPWDLTQLNIEASVMCLVSKVKFLCGRCSSPAVRLRTKNANTAVAAAAARSQSLKAYLSNDGSGGLDADVVNSATDGVVTMQPKNGTISDESSKLLKHNNTEYQNPAMPVMANAKEVCQAVDTMTRVIKSNSAAVAAAGTAGQRNKFTEGLDFASIVDWTSELRPSMKKLRQAMDGLLKTARLTHSVFRVQEDVKRAQRVCNVRYRRDVCFSQALTALVSALMAKLWCQRPDPLFLLIITTLGPIASFESLLSYYGNEIDMWGDMTVAVEDMHTVTFTLSRCGINSRIHEGNEEGGGGGGGNSGITSQIPLPRVLGSRAALTVMLPVPDAIYSLLPLVPSSRQTLSFNVTPVFFNIGINEKATLAESIGTTGPQERSNVDNFDRLNEYYLRFKKLNLPTESGTTRPGARSAINRTLAEMIDDLKSQVQSKVPKNTSVLQTSSQICRRMRGLRFTSCKSAKDRTGMSLTLEQVNILASEYHLSEHEFIRALDCMRSEGCRRENTWKNIGVRKYTFKSSILSLPKYYRPPTGTYG